MGQGVLHEFDAPREEAAADAGYGVKMQLTREISLYSPHLIELMRAVFDKSAAFRFKARGGSMSPFIRDGDILTVARFPGEYAVGDVLAFVRPKSNKLVVHRAVGKKTGVYFIKGDNGFEIDGAVPAIDVLGRVVKVERAGREVKFGLGWEKHFIALFSKYQFLPILFFLPRMGLRLFRSFKHD